MKSDFGTLILGAALLLIMAKLGMVGEAVKVVGGVREEVSAPAPAQTVRGSDNPWDDNYNSALDLGEDHYATCEDAIRAGAAPLEIGMPGYRPDLDPDKDGIACDS